MKKIGVILLSALSFQAFSQTPTGKIVIKTGQHYTVESSSNSTVTQEMMGQSMEMKMTNSSVINAEIAGSKGNEYTIKQTMTNLKSSFSGMGQEKTFDSDKKEDMDGEIGSVLKDKINVPTTVEITNEGKSIIPLDTTKKEQNSNPMTAMMEMMNGVQDISSVMFLVIPAGKKTGDTWQDSTSKEGLKITRTFRLNSISNKEASVTVDAVMDINKKVQLQGMDMDAVMVSKINSAVLIDPVTNIQKENKTITDVTGTINVMGQAVPLTSKITTVTTIKNM